MRASDTPAAPNDFDSRRAAMRARIARRALRDARTRNVITLIAAMVVLVILGSGAWLLMHPEQIGAFFGRIAAGARSTVVAPRAPGAPL